MQKIRDKFNEIGIDFVEFEHPPMHTVEDSLNMKMTIPGAQTKNLFVRDKKSEKYWLIVVEGAKRVDLKGFAKMIGESKLSFGDAEKLYQFLGVYPGSVSPFGLVFDEFKNVGVFIDKDLLDAEFVGFHPNQNTLTWVLKSGDFIRFLNGIGRDYKVVDVPILSSV